MRFACGEVRRGAESTLTTIARLAVASSRMGVRYGSQAWTIRAAINITLVAGALAIVMIGKQLLDLT